MRIGLPCASTRGASALILCLVSALSALPGFASAESNPAQAEPPRADAGSATAQRFRASYKTGVGGIDLGTFEITATVDGNSYILAGKGKFSLLSGLVYEAKGKARSQGNRTAGALTPRLFKFSYKDSKKRTAMRINFDQGRVNGVTRTPKKRPDKQAVPIPEDQLANVLDPLSGAFMSIRSTAPAGDTSICSQTLRIFDGKQRFDLVLSPKRTESLSPNAAKGLTAAAVCKVRYQPIGGYRPGNYSVDFLQKADGIEAWLVPVPGSDIVLPYKVIVPTDWGNGSVTLKAIEALPLSDQEASNP